MAKNKKPSKAEAEKAKLEKAEKNLIEKHGDRIVPGSIRRAPKNGRYGTKLLVTIRTHGLDGKPDGGTREIASSDVHQVWHSPQVKAELDKVRVKEARAKKTPVKN